MENNKITQVTEILEGIKHLLEIKNERYGNAALEPMHIFYRGDAKNSIEIRLDDKLSRIKNSGILRKNDLVDLLGYLYLYCIANNFRFIYNEYSTINKDFSESLSNINLAISERITTYSNSVHGKPSEEIFIDDNPFVNNLNLDIYQIVNGNGKLENYVLNLMVDLVLYFAEEDITDFTDLID